MTENPHPAPEALKDTGALLRALEIAAGDLNAQPPDSVALVSTPVRTLEELAPRLSANGLAARVRTLGTDELLQARGAGLVVLVPVESGWLVLGRKRAQIVTAMGERTVSASQRQLNSLVRDSVTSAILLEPRLNLERLSHRSTKNTRPWARLRPLLAIEGAELGALVVYAIVLGALSLAVPIAVQVLVNTIAFGSLLQPLVILAALLFGVLAFTGLVQVIQWYGVELLERRIFVRVAEDFSRRLPVVSYDTHRSVDVREKANRFFEVVNMQKTAGKLLLDGLGLGLQTLVGLLLLAFYHPIFLAFDVALVAALLVVFGLGYGAVPTAIAESKAKYKFAAWLQTVAGRPNLFRPQAGAHFSAVRADALTRDFLQARRAHYARVLRQQVGGVGVQILAMVSLLGLGGWLVMNRELTLGQLVAAELVVGLIVTGFTKIAKILESGYDLLAGLDKLGHVLDLNVDDRPGALRPPSEDAGPVGAVLSDVALSTRGSDRCGPVSTRIDVGTRLWIDDRGGPHATEMLEALAGLILPDEGSITLVDANDNPLRPGLELTEAMLVRPGEFIEASILDNLRLAKPDLTEEEAWTLLAEVQLSQTVSGFEQGMSTPLYGLGYPLTIAELNRLSLARAIAGSPGLLLIDRTLDNLGLRGHEAANLLTNILSSKHGWTVVVVSRDAEVTKRCDAKLDLHPGGEA